MQVKLTQSAVRILREELVEDLCIDDEGRSQALIHALDKASSSAIYRIVILDEEQVREVIAWLSWMIEDMEEGLLGRSQQVGQWKRSLELNKSRLVETLV